MKKIFIVLFLFTSLGANARKLYVATNGNDNYGGALTAPWLTWRKAFSTDILGLPMWWTMINGLKQMGLQQLLNPFANFF